MFSTENLKFVNKIFGIKFNIPLLSEIPNETFKDFYRNIRIVAPKKFDSIGQVDQDKDIRVLAESSTGRSILLAKDFAQYTENSRTCSDFIVIAKNIYQLYTEKLGVKLEDFKLLGQIVTYMAKIEEDSAKFLSHKLSFLSEEVLLSFETKGVIIDGQHNVHLSIIGNKDGESPAFQDKTIIITVDINNKNQTDGIAPDTFKTTMEFANEFLEHKLCSTLNKYLK